MTCLPVCKTLVPRVTVNSQVHYLQCPECGKKFTTTRDIGEINYHKNYIRRIQATQRELEQAVQESKELRESWKR